MKTLSCSANKSVPWRKSIWCITMKDDIALQFSWYSEIKKQHSNAVRLLRIYAPNHLIAILMFEIDPLECHADSYKRTETT